MAEVVVDPNVCVECGHPKDSRTHLEGRNGIHDGAVAAQEAPQPSSKPEAAVEASDGLEAFTKAELLDLGRSDNVEVNERMTKAEIIAALEAADSNK